MQNERAVVVGRKNLTGLEWQAQNPDLNLLIENMFDDLEESNQCNGICHGLNIEIHVIICLT